MALLRQAGDHVQKKTAHASEQQRPDVVARRQGWFDGPPGLEPVLDLGPMPHSDGLLEAGALAAEEPRYPLEVAFCPDCTLVQILETVDPAVLFGDDYPYYSSFSDALLVHSRAHALDLVAERRLDGDSLALRCADWAADPEARQAWHTYHLIGDVLRSDDLASPAAGEVPAAPGIPSRCCE